MRPDEETYDRRRLTRTAHAIEVRDRSIKDMWHSGGNGMEITYNNIIEAAFVTCRSAFCTVALLRQAGVTEGCDAYTGPVYIGNARFVSVVALKSGTGPHICSQCGLDVTDQV